MPVGTAGTWRRHGVGIVAGLAVVVLMIASLTACESQVTPSPSPVPVDPAAVDHADLFAVVTADELDTLVGIDVDGRTVTRLAVLRENKKRVDMDGGMRSIPPVSSILTDPTQTLVWTWSVATGTIVQSLDRPSSQVLAYDAPGAGRLPFLVDGTLGWASLQGAGTNRLIGVGGAFEIELAREPVSVVPGPGAGRVTVVDAGDPDGAHRIVVVDIKDGTVTELRTERFRPGGIWADDTSLLVSVYAAIVPTLEDPENGEPDTRVLTWNVDAGNTDPQAIAGLVEGPTHTSSQFYPAHVAGGEDVIAVETSVFDGPIVELLDRDGSGPARKFNLLHDEFVYAMSIEGRTLVVLQSSHVTFIGLDSGKETVVALGGATHTEWVGR